jgi:RNA polymerase sigma-70 factor (ECF subfamily)
MDLAQETFLKVFVSLESFDPRYRFTTWLYRIGSNGAIDHLRRKQPRTLSLSHPPGDDDAQPPPAIADQEPSPHDMLRLRELEVRLDDAIADLPAAYRQLIVLRHRQHCRYDEIARITQLPLGTVKNRIFRAREILRSRLADLLDAQVTP